MNRSFSHRLPFSRPLTGKPRFLGGCSLTAHLDSHAKQSPATLGQVG